LFGIFPSGNFLVHDLLNFGNAEDEAAVNSKVQAARLSVASNSLLVVGKLGVGLASGSVSVISEAIHSGIDLIAALIALASVRVSSRPPDDVHSYGHGKVEHLSALVEGALIIIAAGWIIYEAVHKLSAGHGAPEVGLGLWVMGISATLNWFVSSMLLRVAKAEESAALEADAMHLRTDVWTSVGVFVGLLAVRFSGLSWLDPVVAMVVAVMIIKAGWELCAQAFNPLLDSRLSEAEEDEIVGLIEQCSDEFVQYHDLRTRQAGSERHVDFHLVVHGHRSLEAVHRLCDKIEGAICERFPTAKVLIHPEPCAEDCEVCRSVREGTARPATGPRRLKPRGNLVRRQFDPDPMRGFW